MQNLISLHGRPETAQIHFHFNKDLDSYLLTEKAELTWGLSSLAISKIVVSTECKI